MQSVFTDYLYTERRRVRNNKEPTVLRMIMSINCWRTFHFHSSQTDSGKVGMESSRQYKRYYGNQLSPVLWQPWIYCRENHSILYYAIIDLISIISLLVVVGNTVWQRWLMCFRMEEVRMNVWCVSNELSGPFIFTSEYMLVGLRTTEERAHTLLTALRHSLLSTVTKRHLCFTLRLVA